MLSRREIHKWKRIDSISHEEMFSTKWEEEQASLPLGRYQIYKGKTSSCYEGMKTYVKQTESKGGNIIDKIILYLIQGKETRIKIKEKNSLKIFLHVIHNLVKCVAKWYVSQ